MKKVLLIVLAVIVAAGVFGGLGYWYGKNKTASSDNSVDLLTATVAPSDAALLSGTATADPTAG